MRRDVPILILLAISVGLGMIAAGREGRHFGEPDFTGAWELDIGKSHFGKMPAPSRMTLKALNDSGVIHAVQTRYDANGGPESSQGDWFLDGSDRPVSSDGKITETTRWDGNAVVSERKSKDRSYGQLIRLTLSADGKTATEEITVRSPNGSDKSILLWHRS